MNITRYSVPSALLAVLSLVLGFVFCGRGNVRAQPQPDRKQTEIETGTTKQPWKYRPKIIKQQNDSDWTDNRWQQTDTGPFFTASIAMPDGHRPRGGPAGGARPTLKGLAIRVGEKQEATVCYDTAQLRMSAAWTGEFLQLDPARFGLVRKPKAAGKVHFTLPNAPGWAKDGRFAKPPAQSANTNLPDDWAHYQGLYLHDHRVVLKYTVGGTTVLESPWVESHAGQTAFTRTLQIDASEKPMAVRVCDAKSQARVVGSDQVLITADNKSPVTLRIPPHDGTLSIKLLIWSGKPADQAQFDQLVGRTNPPLDLTQLKQPAGRRWKQSIVTKGVRAEGSAPYVVDTLTLPFDNPYHALFFTAGHDFFSNGDIAICTVHGDVWTVSGVNASLKRLTWRRYATGLFQPLGLKIVNDRVYVIGRDQVTRLHDLNQDGEADYYENFNNDLLVTGGDHEYVTCLDTDPAGNFYFIHAKTGVMRLSKDGSRLDSVGTGFRNPNGMGVGPDGTITAAPQEGTWTPASNIVVVKPGGYYGFGGPKITTERPLGYDPPMCYIPRAMDNSSGAQTWVTSDRWGPLAGQMLHLSFGQCRFLLALSETIDGQAQGGVVKFPTSPGDFESGIMRGRFSPHDGQLYVSGLRGWQTRAIRDGCLQRVRYTGQPVRLPIGVRTMKNGIALTFSTTLERNTAENPDNYFLEQWNYRWTGTYGSADYMLSDPRRGGRDEVEVLSATLMDEGKTVFLELDQVKPVMQMSLRYSLKSADGGAMQQTYVHTIHNVRGEAIDADRLTRRTSPGRLPENVEKNLQAGLLARFRQQTEMRPVGSNAPGDGNVGRISNGSYRKSDGLEIRPTGKQLPADRQREKREDTRVSRLAALFLPKGSPPTPFLASGPGETLFEGYLRVPLQGEYSFKLEGRGRATLSIGKKQLLEGTGDLATAKPVEVMLHKGYNRIRLQYQRPASGDAVVRLLWSSAAFHWEAVPPAQWYHDGSDANAAAAGRLRRGRELFGTLHCGKCHHLPKGVSAGRSSMPELAKDTPDLKDTRLRLNREWLYHWLLDPAKVRNGASMPRMLGDPKSQTTRQKSADLTAFLAVAENVKPTATGETTRKLIQTGEVLFEDLGCISCHRLTAPEQDDEFQRTSLWFIDAKFQSGALGRFLRQPHQHYRWSRMPDFQLSATEATSLAAFLRSNVKGTFAGTQMPPGDSKRGEKLFESVGCNHCHAIGKERSPAKDRLPLAFGRVARPDVRKGVACCCPTPFEDSGRATQSATASSKTQSPQFTLSAEDRASLLEFLQTGGQSLKVVDPVETSARFMNRLNCTACHDRDAKRTDRSVIVIEEGSRGLPPEVLPNLTWTGEKLFSSWTKQLLDGSLPYRTRPWLKSRMPRFPVYAQHLAHGMSAQHGIDWRESWSHKSQPELGEIGERLSSKNAGLDCRQCHGVGKLASEVNKRTKDAQGVNFAHIRQRMRHDFYSRFVLDPPRFDIGAKMPKFSEDGRTTKIQEIYNGDAAKQYEALWHYIQSINDLP